MSAIEELDDTQCPDCGSDCELCEHCAGPIYCCTPALQHQLETGTSRFAPKVVIDLLCGCNEEIAFHQDATSDWMSP
jgi:hypothetical protein